MPPAYYTSDAPNFVMLQQGDGSQDEQTRPHLIGSRRNEPESAHRSSDRFTRIVKSNRVHPATEQHAKAPDKPVQVFVVQGFRNKKALTWSEVERPKTSERPKAIIFSSPEISDESLGDKSSLGKWNRPFRTPQAQDWNAEMSALMRFVGAEAQIQSSTAGDIDIRASSSIVQTLCGRVRKMSVQEREDLYRAMRSIVTMAESTPEEENLMLNTRFNRAGSTKMDKAPGDWTHNDVEVLDLARSDEEEPTESVVFSGEEGPRSSIAEVERIKTGVSFVSNHSSSRATEGIADTQQETAKTAARSTEANPRLATEPSKKNERRPSRTPSTSTDRIKDWRKDRDSVDRMIRNCRIHVASIAFAATVAAMAQHELVLRGYAPQHILVNASKALNTLLSMILVMMIYRLHWLGELFQRIRAHLRLLLPLNTSISPLEILCKPKFLALSLLNFLHLPPGVTFEFGVVNWDNFVLYRGETICMMFNTLRIFLFAQCFVHIFLFRLPRRHTVSSFTGVRMNSAFCFKEILNSDSALHVITIFWFIMLLVLGYWFRAVESTACLFGATVDKTSVGFASDFGSNSSLAGSPVLETTSLHEGCKNENAYRWKVWMSKGYFDKVNDTYLWNAMWSMFSSSTSVGWGDVLPTTHSGRVVSGMASIGGVIMMALLTSSFMSNLHYTPEEESATLMLKKERAVRAVGKHAAAFLQTWYRLKQANGDQKTRERFNRRKELRKMRNEFKKIKQVTSVDFHDMCADNVKIDQIAVRSKYIMKAAEVIHHHTEPELLSIGHDPDKASALLPQRPKTTEELSLFERGAWNAAERKVQKEEANNEDGKRKYARMQWRIDQVKRQRLTYIVKEKDKTSNPAQDLGSAMMQALVLARNPSRRWRFDRASVESRLRQSDMYAAVAGLTGMCVSIFINELMVWGYEPSSLIMVTLKIANSALALATIICLYKIYHTKVIYDRLNRHLRRGSPYDEDVWFVSVLFGPKSFWFWLELLVNLLHMPFFVTTTFEISSTFMSNVVVYKLETITCACAILRVYLLWRPLVDHILKDFPSKHNVAAFANIEFDSMFVFKWMLNSWHAIFYLASGWFCMLMVASYAFRLAEHMHSCALPNFRHADCQKENAKNWDVYGEYFEKENDLNYFNAVWFILTCITPGAGGNIIVATHFGRIVSSASVICGLLMQSLTTAALGNLMIFTPAEHTTRGIIRREGHRQKYLEAAANIIALWWRKRRSCDKLTSRQRKSEMHGYRKEFVYAGKALKVDIEECTSMSTKIDQISTATKHVEEVLDDTGKNIFKRYVVAQRKQQHRSDAICDIVRRVSPARRKEPSAP